MCNDRLNPEEPFEEPTIPLEEIENHIRELASGMDENIFTMRKASEWLDIASNRPIPKMLFGSLPFHQSLHLHNVPV